MDDAGFSVPQNVDISVPAGQEESAHLIVGSCPEGAIKVI
jgi:ferredoxin